MRPSQSPHAKSIALARVCLRLVLPPDNNYRGNQILSNLYMQLVFDALQKTSRRLLGNYLTASLFNRLFRQAPDEVAALRHRVRLPVVKRQTSKARKNSAATCELAKAAEALFLKYEELLARIVGSEVSIRLVYSALVRAGFHYRRANFQHGLV